MEQTANSAQAHDGDVEDRKATAQKGQGLIGERVDDGTKSPEKTPTVPSRSQVNPGTKRREAVWSELHYPDDAGLPDVDPRSTGDPTGDTRRFR